MSKDAWHKGYQEVRNVIHNEMGITKEEILDIFRQVAKDEIQKIVSEERSFVYESIREVIHNQMISAVSDHDYPHVRRHLWSYGHNGAGVTDFKDFISGVMQQEIMDKLYNMFEVNVSIDMKKPNNGVDEDE